MSGAVHKGKIKGKGKGRKKGGGTGGKERWILLDRRRTQGKLGRRNGATERIGTENMEGTARIAKRRRHRNRGRTRKARKMHKKPRMKTPLLYIKVKTGKTGKGRGTHRKTGNKRNYNPEEKTGQGRPKTEGKRRTPDKKTARN